MLGYSIVRPVRETMGTMGGARQLSWLFLATFIAMLVAVPIYSALVARLPRRWLVRVVYHFFAICLLVFWIVMGIDSQNIQIWTARIFFVWVNVFALFNTSVFWSVLADLFTNKQGKRLFGMIATGATVGAIIGSLLTSLLVTHLSIRFLILLPIGLLEAGLWCAWRLEKQSGAIASADPGQTSDGDAGAPTAGGLWAGITGVLRSPYLATLCLFLLFVQLSGTQLYFQQAEIVKAAFETDEQRTRLFAAIDLGTQLLTLFAQAILAGPILRKLGVSFALAILPVVYGLSFAGLAWQPTLIVLVIAMIATRASAYGITVPAREVLFTVVSREDKYKSKSFIDTVVMRGGDAAASQVFGLLRPLMALHALSVLMLPVTVIWAGVAWALGQQQKRLATDIVCESKSTQQSQP
ncbi:MAG: MFS transporter [Pirellulaceae bacterium]|nr:MFS transporter [Pirellulaceae bacterium]